MRNPVRNNGSRTCGVCGTEVEHHESLGGLSDYYSCPKCIQRIEKRLNNRPFLAEKLERSQVPIEHTNNWIRLFSLILIILLISTIGSAMITRAATNEVLVVDVQPDPIFEDITNPQELGEGGTPNVTISEWQFHLGSSMPNGSFFGTLLSGSLFEHKFRPYYFPTGTFYEGIYSFAMLSAHFNWSYQVLISGCSEWWVRLPVRASSIERTWGLYLCIFEGASNLTSVYFDDNEYYTYPLHVRPTNDGYVPDDLINFAFPWYSADEQGLPVIEGAGDIHVADGRVYLKVHSILRPNIDYVISVVFRLPQNGKLQTYWTGGESPAGRNSSIAFVDLDFEYESSNSTHKISTIDQEVVQVPLDFDWSFIFTEGIGEGGLFGVRVPVINGSMLSLYPFFNTTTNTSFDGLLYMSFMLPWISNDEFNISLAVGNAMEEPPTYDCHHWQFEPDSGSPGVPPSQTFSWVPTYSYTYRDFLVFSTNWTLDFDDITYNFNVDDRWNVNLLLTFNNAGNLTFLCYDEERPQVLWTSLDPYELNSTLWPFFRSVLYYDAASYVSYQFNFGIYCSGRGTWGQWALRSQTLEGVPIYTYYFPNVIHLSESQYHIVKDDEDEPLEGAELAWQEFRDLWGEGHYLRALGAGITAVALTLWDGASRIYCTIKDGISFTWEQMKRLGSWLHTNLPKLYDKIVNFLEDVWDVMVGVIDIYSYLVAPMILMGIYGGISYMLVRYLRSRNSPKGVES